MIAFLTTDFYGYPLWLCLVVLICFVLHDPAKRRRRDPDGSGWFTEDDGFDGGCDGGGGD